MFSFDCWYFEIFIYAYYFVLSIPIHMRQYCVLFSPHILCWIQAIFVKMTDNGMLLGKWRKIFLSRVVIFVLFLENEKLYDWCEFCIKIYLFLFWYMCFIKSIQLLISEVWFAEKARQKDFECFIRTIQASTILSSQDFYYNVSVI